jgi:phosphoribosyl 1,2-cyclic phosphodiesterase
MKISVLASGSKGNCSLIITNKVILIDAGMNLKYINKQLKELGINHIDAILLTHTHDDHIIGLPQLIKKYNPTIFLSDSMYFQIKDRMPISNYVIIEDSFAIDHLKVTAVKLSHDSEEVNAYVFNENGKEMVYITDTGYINSRYNYYFTNKSTYIIESNYDVDMLMNGRYPHHLKRRILSDKGHLSNVDTARYLKKFVGDNTKKVILIHLSENNNNPDKVSEIMKTTLANNIKYIVSSQNERTELIEID